MGDVIFMPPNEKLRYDANACSKSSTKSRGSSTPTHTRTMSSGKSLDARTSAGIEACDMSHGQLINEWTDPKDTVMLKSFVEETTCFDSSTSPVVKHTTHPPPVAWDKWSSRSG